MCKSLSIFISSLILLLSFDAMADRTPLIPIPTIMMCADKKELNKFMKSENYVEIVSGISTTMLGESAYNIIFGKNDSVVFVSYFTDNTACFLGDISDDLEFRYNLEKFLSGSTH